MKYKTYLPDTPDVSQIGLGAWQLGVGSGWSPLSDNEAHSIVHEALALGINFFDTAPNYGLGTGEERLGEALKIRDRSSVVINTKFGHTSNGKMDYRSKTIRSSLEGSLRRLKTDYVDSLIIHNPPKELLDGKNTDHYEIFEKLKVEGKIKAYGASVDTAEEMRLLMDSTGSQVIEAFFNIHFQGVSDAFEQAMEQQVAIIAKIPLDSGWLTGKYNAQSTFTGIRERWSKHDIRTRSRLVGKVRDILGPDLPLPSAAIAFCLTYDAVSTVIPGALNLDQLHQNVKSIQMQLPEAVIQSLQTLYKEQVAPLRIPW